VGAQIDCSIHKAKPDDSYRGPIELGAPPPFYT
jgi:hypothetical protein